jgi:hypothetical protein
MKRQNKANKETKVNKEVTKAKEATKATANAKSLLMTVDVLPVNMEERLALATPDEIAAVKAVCEAAGAADYARRSIDVAPELVGPYEGPARAAIISLGLKDNGHYGATLSDFYACHCLVTMRL